jgi:N-acetylmuramoyl-L-alanine amidase
MIVLHYTAMQNAAVALERLSDPAVEVSAHYLIDTGGQVFEMVAETERAWHAGAGSWAGAEDINSRSIGIELANPASLSGFPPFPAAQFDALETLLGQIRQRWSIVPERVIGHSDMAPARKADPGPKFDWARLARAGHSVWPGLNGAPDGQEATDAQEAPDAQETQVDAAAFHADLARFGYPDAAPEHLLNAFRLRFRPWAVGRMLETGDCMAARTLARHYPANAPLRSS